MMNPLHKLPRLSSSMSNWTTKKRRTQRRRRRRINLSAIKTQQVSPSKEVPKVIPFDTYKHKLTHPFWCEYCNKKGHLQEYCRLALKYLPQYTPTKLKPNPIPKILKGERKAKAEITTRKPTNKSNKKKQKLGCIRRLLR